MVSTALSGFARPASIPWPQQSPGYDAAQDQSYAFDLGKAGQLFEAAGWDANATLPLAIPGQAAQAIRLAEIYQADLATIGVKLAIQELPAVEFLTRLQTGGFGSAWLTTMAGMNLSPSTFLTSSFVVRIPNTGHFATPRYQEVQEQVRSETDDRKLKELLHELNQILLDESFVAPIAEAAVRDVGPEVAHASVRGATWNTFGLFAFEDVWLEQ